MPTSILLECNRAGDGWWERPEAVRAAVYALLSLGDADTATAAHALIGVRPFSVAVACDRGKALLRVAAFESAAEEALLCGVAKLARGGTLPIPRQEIVVTGCRTDEAPLAMTATWETLLSTPLSSRWALDFATPTAFSQGDRPYLPLPVPERLVASWGDRWNRFAPEPCRFDSESRKEAASLLALSRFEVSSAVVRRAKSVQIGFVGSGIFELTAKAPDEARRILSALFAFAPYAGSGHGVTLGFGLTLPRLQK